jgi:hypothetical protein
MRNIALAIVVLAVTIPAMADVEIIISNDANKVTIGYECTGGEKVRAFALNIDVNNSAFVVGSADFAGDPEHDDYYICPGSMTFTVEDSNTVIDSFGTPIAEQDANGGVLEIASLYALSDPCHTAPPASANDLATFYVDCSGGDVTVTLSENGERGGVVLEDPNEEFTLVLPDPYSGICEPPCWSYPCFSRGDTNGDNIIDSGDLLGTDGPGGAVLDGWYDAWNTQYHECADINKDGVIDSGDLLGSDGPGGAILDGWYDGWNNQCP